MNFNWVDLIIILILIGSVGRGLRVGFIRQVLAIVGFFLGLFVGGWAIPHLLPFIKDTGVHALVSAMLVLGFATAIAILGDGLVERLHLKLVNGWILRAESAAGIALSIASVFMATWFIGAMVVRLPFEDFSNGISDSLIIQDLNGVLPPAPAVFAGLNKLIGPNSFPKVFVDIEPHTKGPVTPSTAEAQQATNKAQASIVKISGFGCGGVVYGSGFVVGPDLVATNAHVIAGVRRPIIHDLTGNHAATPVVFDPNLDFAVLRTSHLAGPVLDLASQDVPDSTTVAVLGYPGGGDFTANSGVILDKIHALGSNIYNTGKTKRDVYELQAVIEPGNSGGPLVLPNGQVAGMVFARATNDPNYGYALTSNDVVKESQQARTATERVSTGPCAAD